MMMGYVMWKSKSKYDEYIMILIALWELIACCVPGTAAQYVVPDYLQGVCMHPTQYPCNDLDGLVSVANRFMCTQVYVITFLYFNVITTLLIRNWGLLLVDFLFI